MPGAIAVRVAAADVVTRLVALINTAFALERAFVDRDRTTVDEIAGMLNRGTFLVADEGEADFACCVYVEKRGDRAYIGMLAVHPSQQKRGLGRKMMAAAEAHGAAVGCRGIDIRIVNRRTELPPFYRSLGYVDAGTEAFEDPLLTKPCHFILMSKELSQ